MADEGWGKDPNRAVLDLMGEEHTYLPSSRMTAAEEAALHREPHRELARQYASQVINQRAPLLSPPRHETAAYPGAGPPPSVEARGSAIPSDNYGIPSGFAPPAQRAGSLSIPPLHGALAQDIPINLATEVMRDQGFVSNHGKEPLEQGAGGTGGAGGSGGGSPGTQGSKDKQTDSASCQRKVVKRSSKYRGVTRHRRSGRWEAHIWVKSTGKQVYLGGYELEEHAAEAYDVAAIKCKGPSKVKPNFPIEKYAELMKFMDKISLEELVMAVRRQSQGFSRGSSGYRGVTHHPNGRWEARIGMPGSKHIYLGLYSQEQAAARAYDRALVKLRGPAAATNFALSDYPDQLSQYHERIETAKNGAVDVVALLKEDTRNRNHPSSG